MIIDTTVWGLILRKKNIEKTVMPIVSLPCSCLFVCLIVASELWTAHLEGTPRCPKPACSVACADWTDKHRDCTDAALNLK